VLGVNVSLTASEDEARVSVEGECLSHIECRWSKLTCWK
jgi:hypothetical protein